MALISTIKGRKPGFLSFPKGRQILLQQLQERLEKPWLKYKKNQEIK